ncbi:hypothetical protein BASA81_001972 [Batrachochytrium salamandrivorans]|nr:hypothetical protein BASA81_001972 [Batrachochytrium salamandrivorans]
MLQDLVRTSTYKRAIAMNASSDFKNRVVLDVGCGSGILSLFAAQAGAKHVYGVEAAPEMAAMARLLVSANGLAHKITIITGKVEEISLPEQVDVIVSEPIGFLLVHERMLESYIVARERFLKPVEVPRKQMFPSRATIRVQPFSDWRLHNELKQRSEFWAQQSDFFGVDLQCLQSPALMQAFSQPVIGNVDVKCLMSQDVCSHEIDFETARVQEDLSTISVPLRFVIHRTGLLHGLACWFDAEFLGGNANIKLDTSPAMPTTHWYQVRLLLALPLAVNAHQTVIGEMFMRVNQKFSYDISIQLELEGTRERIQSMNHIALHDPYYSHSPSSHLDNQIDTSGAAYRYDPHPWQVADEDSDDLDKV